VCERLVVLLPLAWDERRDRGLVRAELGQDDAAAQDIVEYLNQLPQADDAGALRQRLRDLAGGRHRPLH
jgi:regulator of sirC expression with transglutaminase-like and TPR domain